MEILSNNIFAGESDCKSGLTGSNSCTIFQRAFSDAVPVSGQEQTYHTISQKFLSSMVENTQIVSIYKRNYSENFVGQARARSFQLHVKALAASFGSNGGGDDDGDGGESGGGGDNSVGMKFGLYGGCFERVQRILSRGFSLLDVEDSESGVICLSPFNSIVYCMEKASPDEDGVRHLLLCRVLMGRSEIIDPNSKQTQPSSNEFTSGVDDYENPTKYFIWSDCMNSHILPEFIISFTTPMVSPPPVLGISKMMEKKVKTPTSPWMTFPALISVLEKFLSCDAICLMTKYHHQYKVGKIPRAELVKIVRQIAGDKLLLLVMKSCRGVKELKMPFGFLRSRNFNK